MRKQPLSLPVRTNAILVAAVQSRPYRPDKLDRPSSFAPTLSVRESCEQIAQAIIRGR